MNRVLCSQDKKHFVITEYVYDNMKLIVDLLRPFQEATEILSAEKYVTISFVLFFVKLKEHLTAKGEDNQMIKEMKKHMFLKFNNRYTEIKNFLKYLLFIRY